MDVTRRFWVLAAMGVFLAAVSVRFERPFLLVGAAGIGAWLIATQYAFAWTLVRFDDMVQISQAVSPERGFTTQQFHVTLSVSAADRLPYPVDVSIQPPPSVTGIDDEPVECRLSPADDKATVTGTFRSPVAGRVRFDSPTVYIADTFGLFQESFRRGDPTTATVEPPQPTDVRVGHGDVASVSEGTYPIPQGGESLVFRSLREYVPTDPANRIDWRATARLAEPQVLEFERQTDHRVEIVIDRRREMTVGDPGRTKLDYCRAVALSFVDGLEQSRDPTGLLVFDDDGVVTVRDPRSNREWYKLLRTLLHDQVDSSLAADAAGSGLHPSVGELALPDAGARARKYLATDRTDFGRSILPFAGTERPLPAQTTDDSLFSTVEMLSKRLSGPVVTAIFTDDSRPVKTRESVKLARRGEGQVVVFLTPTVLFEPQALDDVESVYERYRSFESFRRELDRLRGVSAHEVSPGGRSDAVRAAVEYHQ